MPIRPLSLLATAALFALASPARAEPNERGLDARNLDTKIAACNDFYHHANGGWLKAHPVPAGRASWGLFDEMAERNLQQQREILESAAAAPKDDLDRLLGTLYAAGIDEAAIEAAGAQPLAPLIAQIDRLKKPKDLAPVLAALHGRGLPVLFDFGVNDDLQDPARRIAYANQGGLGLPDRDYYLRQEPPAKTLLAAYRAYVERVLALSGSTQAARDADTVLQVETRLAQASLSLLQLRDPATSYRPTALKDLRKTYRAIDWKGFLRAQDLARVDRVSLAHVTFFGEIESLSKTLTPEQWRAYLRFHVAHSLAPYLSRGFQDAHEALYLRTLRGNQEPLPRWRRVLTTVDTLLDYGIGRRYAEKHFPEASRAAAEAVVQGVRAALRSRIEGSNWLGAEAKPKALAKLDALDVKLGHSPRWPSFEGLKLDASPYATQVLTVIAWRHRRMMSAIDKPREDWQWPQSAQALNAYYDPARNQLVLPAGFLQPPLLDPAADAALNYGGLGALVAHELMHGFDVLGSTFDADGKLAAWWTSADANGFALRTKPLELQYDAYSALGPLKVSGRLTLAENIADLGGLEVAWTAFQATSPGNAALQGHTPDQRFHLAWAQAWRRNYTDEELTLLLRTDVRAPAKFRVNGPFANLAPFAESFKCKPGKSSFVRVPTDRVTVW
jgi:putative endopeptidase